MATSNYRLSTSRKCIATYPSTKKTPQNTASPTASDHSARLLKPKELRIAEPGTLMSRPYLWSARLRYRTSFTIRPSKPKWKIES